MNRLLVAVALSLSVFGCAVGTEDVEPAPTPVEPQRDPPKQTLSGSFENPYDKIAVGVDDYRLPPEVGPLQAPPIPGR
jgi:hypothetical protein